MSAQFSLFTRRQALAAGYSKREIDGRLAKGVWLRVYDGVYQLPGLAASWRRTLLALQLWGGEDAVLSHRSAAALLRLEGFEEGTLELTLIRRRRPVDGAIVHFTDHLPPRQVCQHDPFRITSVPRTLLDLCSVVGEERIEVGLCDGLRRRLTSIAELQAFVDEAPNRGKRGAGLLRKLLGVVDHRGLRSTFEVLFARLLRSAQFPLQARYNVALNGKVIAELDFAFPDQRIGVECDGHGSHVQKKDFQRNVNRYNQLELAGWRVLRFTWYDLKHRPEYIISTIRQALAQAAA